MATEVIGDEAVFYSKAEKYWKDVPPTVDGMLGGYGSISNIDIHGSSKFLQRFLGVGSPVRTRAGLSWFSSSPGACSSRVTCDSSQSNPESSNQVLYYLVLYRNPNVNQSSVQIQNRDLIQICYSLYHRRHKNEILMIKAG